MVGVLLAANAVACVANAAFYWHTGKRINGVVAGFNMAAAAVLVVAMAAS